MKATIEELRKEFFSEIKSTGVPLDIDQGYIKWLEQKLIQPEPQRGVKSAKEYIHSKYWFDGAYIGIDENSLFQLMEEYADQKTLPYIVDKNVKLFNELKNQSLPPIEPKVSVFKDLFDNNNPIEITSDKKMEVCMNCAEIFDINYSGCICTTCFLGGENGTLDAEVFMNGCNIIPDASNEDGHDAWTKESVLMLMQLFYKAQSKHSLSIVSEPKQVTEDEMFNKLDNLILNWLKSRSESVTQLSFDIVEYFKGLSLKEPKVEWVSVDERLPEIGVGGVMVSFKSKSSNEVWLSTANYDESGWIAEYNLKVVEITHWMPLPTIPKQ